MKREMHAVDWALAATMLLFVLIAVAAVVGTHFDTRAIEEEQTNCTSHGGRIVIVHTHGHGPAWFCQERYDERQCDHQ